MANKARDFLARFVSDTSRFDTKPVDRAMEGTAREADQASRNVESSWGRLSTAGERVGAGFTKGAKGAFKRAGAAVGADFASTLGSSLQASDIKGVATGIAGGLAGAFAVAGPVGAAIGALGAMAIGTFANMQSDAERLKGAIGDAFDELIHGADDAAKFQNRLKDLFGDTQTGLEKLAELSAATGVPLSTIEKGLTAGKPAADALLASLNKMVDAGTTYTATAVGKGGAAVVKSYTDQAAAAQELSGFVADAATSQGIAATNAKTYNDALKDVNKTLGHIVVNAGTAASLMSTIRQQVPSAATHVDYTSGPRP